MRFKQQAGSALKVDGKGAIDVTSTKPATKALDANAARKRISTILKSGQFTLSRHAREEMEKDDLTEVDVVNVLRGGHITEPAEEVKGTWRYRVHTNTLWSWCRSGVKPSWWS